MDNNFNMQQSMNQQMPQQPMGQPMYQQVPQQPMGQPMYQQMPQQPMGQPMNQQVPQQPMEQSMYYQIPQQRKKKTGLIIAIVSAAVVCILVTIFATVMMQKSRIKNADIVGTWVDDDGNSITFKKGNTGTIDIKEYGMSFNIKWEKEDEIIKISLIYMGQVSEVQEWTIVNFKDKEMTLKYDGSAEVFKKKK